MTRSFKKNQSGATAIEYGLMIALLAVVILSCISILGSGRSRHKDATIETAPASRVLH